MFAGRYRDRRGAGGSQEDCRHPIRVAGRRWSTECPYYSSGCRNPCTMLRSPHKRLRHRSCQFRGQRWCSQTRSEEHTSELQSHLNLVCRLLLEKKKKYYYVEVIVTRPHLLRSSREAAQS